MLSHLTYGGFLQDSQFYSWHKSIKRNKKILTQKYQIDPSICIILWLNQVTLQPKFNLNNVTCIYPSICSIMFYYSEEDLKHE